MRRKVVPVTDFRGGYATSLPPEVMEKNMLQKAENVHWRDGLQKRQGWSTLTDASVVFSAFTTPSIKAFHRFRINGGWHTLLVVSDDTDRRIVIDATEVDSSFTMSDGDFYIDSLADKAVIVNGVDKPVIVYHDGSDYVVKNLEAYDQRERDNDDWYAGTYQSSAYVDDTTDAQDAGVADFPVSTTTSGDGFYIASAVTFNKFVAATLSGDVAGTAVYEYYAGDGTWTAFTPTTDTGWDAAEDTTVEWGIFGFSDGEFLWKKFGDASSQEDPVDASGDTVSGGMIGKYVIRVTFTGTPVAQTVAYFTLYHSQYLTQITAGDKPERVKLHKNRIWLSSGSAVNYSPFGSLKGWHEYNVEYFREGGNKILAMETNGRELYVFKAGAIHGLRGDTFENFQNEHMTDRGTLSGRSVGVIDKVVPFIDDGGLYVWDGAQERNVSRHILSDIEDMTKTNACGIGYKGMYWMSFPSDSVVLVFDLDTIRQDDLGEYRVSFWKYTNIQVYGFEYYNGDGDSLKLVGRGSDDLIELENGNYYDETDTAIQVDVKTKEFTFGIPFHKKTYNRVKLDVLRSEDWTITVNADEEDNDIQFVLHSFGPEVEHHIEEVSMPYEMDGRSLAIRLENDTIHNARIFGFSVDLAARRY